MTSRTTERKAFFQRQREAYAGALRRQASASTLRDQVLELLDAGRSEDEIAAQVGWPVELVRRTAAERGR